MQLSSSPALALESEVGAPRTQQYSSRVPHPAITTASTALCCSHAAVRSSIRSSFALSTVTLISCGRELLSDRRSIFFFNQLTPRDWSFDLI
ncbi:hypothetical protein L596_017057 [Steinernema carpocapsae]|uniref:Uncharacterized protein n=1 Tax=Steinernema carpocapsae TaxID=34508 RepID=A0A4U5N0P8_STECR|nr:hypothetical protein L596_017057 [Steinernema carpocapsae]